MIQKPQEHYETKYDALVGGFKVFLLNQGGTVTVLLLIGAFAAYSQDKNWTRQTEDIIAIKAQLEAATILTAGARERDETILSAIKELLEAHREHPVEKASSREAYDRLRQSLETPGKPISAARPIPGA